MFGLSSYPPAPKRMAAALAMAAGLGCGAPAEAQVTFDVIGPHEYELPVGFKPFNVFVQYATFQDSNRLWDSRSKRKDAPGADVIVGMSKYVRFWSPESHPDIGIAYEIIVPEVSIRSSANRSSSSGIGDPLTGPAIWYKPSANATLGFQTFMQVPVGDSDVGGGDVWKNYSSLFWDLQLGKVSYTADAGFVFFGKSTDADATPGTIFHTNHRLGYAMGDVVEPFVALDYESQAAWTNKATGTRNPRNRELTAGLGVMFKYYGNQSLTLRYSGGIEGKNRAATNSLNLKYAYAW